MKVAFLIQCHKNPEQINLFLDTMQHQDFRFFIHVDSKAEIGDAILHRSDIVVLPDEMRVDVQWGTISQVDASLSLMRSAKNTEEFDFFWLCSGQDFPLTAPESIAIWFNEHPSNDFIELFETRNSGLGYSNNYDKRNDVFFPIWLLGKKPWCRVLRRSYVELTGGYRYTFSWARRKHNNQLRFFFGSSWVCLSKRTLDWILSYLDCHPDYYLYFRNCSCPDESFFQTLVMNSPFAKSRMDYLHYVDWSEKKNNPKVLTVMDIEKMKSSHKLMGRKFDITVDAAIIHLLREKAKNCTEEKLDSRILSEESQR